MATHFLSELTLLNSILPSEVVTLQQTDSTAHKLKPRFFTKSVTLCFLYKFPHLAQTTN